MEFTLDLEESRQRLEGWLASKTGSARVDRLEVPGHGGLSHDTLIVDAEIAGESAGLVVRVEPAGSTIFPEYDLAREWTILERLGRSTSVPVPTLRWFESDQSVLGRRFFVMDRVPGEVPGDDPPFLLGGFLHDASPSRQAAAQEATIDTLAAIHRVDWQALALDETLARQTELGPAVGISAELAWWRAYLDWAAEDGPLPLLERVYIWCAEHQPVQEPAPTLCWGDARYGNVVYDERCLPVAVLDWEMALLGPPEIDLGWFLFIHDTARMWLPELAGFAQRDEVIRRYERSLGRAVADLRWYEVWAGLRAAAIQCQIVRRQIDRGGRSDPEAREDNPVVLSLARLIDLGVSR